MSNDRIYYSHEAEDHAMRRITVLTILWLMVGLGVGAVLALLFAPSSGKKARKQIARSVEERLNSGQDAIDPVINRLEKEVKELRDTLEERISKLK